MGARSAKGPKSPKSTGGGAAEYRAANHFKVCSQCGEEKALNLFPLYTTRKYWYRLKASDPNKYRAACKDCSRAVSAVAVDPAFRKIADRNRRVEKLDKPKKLTKKEQRARNAGYKRKQRRNTRIRALEYLARKGCCECGERDPRVLEFDHIDPKKKDKTIAWLASVGYAWSSKRLREEILKCRVICANCHRRHTIEQQNHYAHPDVVAALRRIDAKYRQS